MNFSPYSPSPDDDRGTRKSFKQPIPGFSSYQAGHAQSIAEQGGLGNNNSSSSSQTTNNSHVRVNKFETAVPIRVDIEAALCYVFGPITGLFFLIFETQNDYVRFHAWQVKPKKNRWISVNITLF
ncbi:hypothetical protein BY458DRAFT_509332 [Sporodiniella umbellata]|nr:hypothetical protein BY458DRAFT_509332 [Sporodiniella umbellata]